MISFLYGNRVQPLHFFRQNSIILPVQRRANTIMRKVEELSAQTNFDGRIEAFTGQFSQFTSAAIPSC